MIFEESLGQSVFEQLVVRVIFSGFFEGELALDNSINDDTKRKYVDFSAIVLLSLANLRSHVSTRTNLSVQSREVALGSQSKVKKLEVHLVIEEHVI